jgi:hypothetical protein
MKGNDATKWTRQFDACWCIVSKEASNLFAIERKIVEFEQRKGSASAVT